LNRFIRALLVAPFVVPMVGCGSDEPALKEGMSDSDKKAYETKIKSRAEVEGAKGKEKEKSGTGGQHSDEYKNSQGGRRPGSGS